MTSASYKNQTQKGGYKAWQAAQDAIGVDPANREAQAFFKDLQGR
jgi:hypothetical protein